MACTWWTCYAMPSLQAYYARFGMQRAVGMCIRRYERVPT